MPLCVAKGNDTITNMFLEKNYPYCRSMWQGAILHMTRTISAVLQSILNGQKIISMLPYFSEIIVFKKGSNKSSRRNVDPNYDFRWIKRSRYGYTRLFLFLNAPILLTKEANPKKLKFVEKPKVSNINFTGIQHQQYRICERLACINGLRTQNF